jgi:BNR repeat-containing family member
VTRIASEFGAQSLVELGGAWAGSSVNCVPFRHCAIVPIEDGCVVGYYGPDAEVVLQWVDGALKPSRRVLLSASIVPFDAHTCISLGTDGTGAVHGVFGAHASPASHLRVEKDSMHVTAGALPFLDGSPAQFTYPMLFRSSAAGDLKLLYRRGGAWNSELRVARWRADAGMFECDQLALLSGRESSPASGPYVNRPVQMADGRVALFCVWRLHPDAASGGEVVNVGLDLVVADASLRVLQTIDGISLQLPVTPVQCPRIWAVPFGASLMNQGAAAAAPDDTPLSLTYWSDAEGIPQYHLVWRKNTVWNTTVLSHFRTRFRLAGRGTLALPHSRPELLVRRDGTALCLFRSEEFGNRLMLTLAAPPYSDPTRRCTVTLLDLDLGHYEPVVDHSSFARDGSLTVYVQWCAQGRGDGQRQKQSAPAYLARWSADQVAAWNVSIASRVSAWLMGLRGAFPLRAHSRRSGQGVCGTRTCADAFERSSA